jgi:hypothetical protein
MAETSVPASNQLDYRDITVQDLDKLLSMARGARSRFEPTWHLNYAYYFGEQWLFWNRGRLDRPRLDPHRVTLTDNRIIGIVRTELAKMTKQKPAWQVIPTTPLQEDVQASEMGEKVLEYLWRHLHMRDRLVDVLLWSRITGAGFWKVVWDNAQGKKVSVIADEEGKPVMHSETGAPMRPEELQDEQGNLPGGLQPKTIATGDVHIETVAPFEMLVDPIAWRMEDAEWCIQENVKSQEYVRQHYGIVVPTDTDIAPGPTEARMFPSYQMGGTSNYKGVKLHEYWCKPNQTHPEGRRAVWCKGKILYEGANPYKCLPYVMFTGVPVPGRFWPTSVVEQLRGPQTELNKIRSQILESAQRMGNPAILISRQAGTNISGVPGERIDYDDTTPNAVPTYLTPPPMPAYVLQQQEKIEQSIEAIAGQHEVSNAQVPAGVKAASAINLLMEADDTRLGPAIYDMEETLGVAGGMLLKLVAQYFTEDRTIMIAGEDHALDATVFKGAALKGNTHVEVQAGSQFPKSKAAQQAAIQDQLALYFQYQGGQPMNKRMLGKVLKDMDAGSLAKLFGDISVDESQINRENQQLAQGVQLVINAFDNHEAHIEGHEEYQKGATYLQLGPEVARDFETHINQHREQLIKAQQGMMQQGPQKSPMETLNYKDAPPDIRRQIEQQAGLEPSKDESLEVKEREHPPAVMNGKPPGGSEP